MSDLLGTRPSDTFGFLLQAPGGFGSGVVVIQDGRGLPSCLSLSSGTAQVSGTLTATGSITATSFSGNGANLTNLSGAAVVGVVPAAAGGTGSSTPAVPTSRTIVTGTNLTGGGDLTANRTLAVVGTPTFSGVNITTGGLSLANGSGNLTFDTANDTFIIDNKVDFQGPAIFEESLTVGGTIQGGVVQATSFFAGPGNFLTNLNAGSLVGSVPIANGGTSATTANQALVNLGAAPSARQIIAGTNLTGGGDLTSNRTLSLSANPSVATLTTAGTLSCGGLATVAGGAVIQPSGGQFVGLSLNARTGGNAPLLQIQDLTNTVVIKGTADGIFTAKMLAGDGASVSRVLGAYFPVDSAFVPASGQTLQVMETFKNVGTLDSSTPGNLGTINAGQWLKRQGGPTFAGSSPYGWSAALPFHGELADGTNLNDNVWTFANYPGAYAKGMICGWFRFWDFGGAGNGSGPGKIMGLETSNAGINFNWLAEKISADGTRRLTASTYYGGDFIVGNVTPHTWNYLAIAWDNAGNGLALKLRFYWMRVGIDRAPRLVATSDYPFQFSDPNQVHWHRYRSFGSTDWWGRLGTPALYGLNSLAAAASHPGEFRPPFERPNEWIVDSLSGNDANAGVQGAPWLTLDKVAAEIANCGIMGSATSWYDLNRTDCSLVTIPNVADKINWKNAYDRNERVVGGDTIKLDTSSVPLQINSPISFDSLPGIHLTSGTSNRADIRVNRPLVDTWVQANSGTYPHVWKTTGSGYAYSVPYEWQPSGWAIPTIVDAANATAAIPLLEAIGPSGGFFADSTTGKLYLRAIGSGNPNTDGVLREYSPNILNSDGALILIADGKVSRLNLDGGFTYDPTTGPGLPRAQELVGIDNWVAVTVVDDCIGSRSGKHTFALTSNSCTDGLAIFKNVKATLGPPVPGGNASHFVTYTPSFVPGNAVSIFDTIGTYAAVSNVGSPGGTDVGAIAYLSHSNGGSGLIPLIDMYNSDFGAANISLGGPETSLARATKCKFGGSLGCATISAVLDQCYIGSNMPGFACASGAIIRDSILTGGTVYTGGPQATSGVINYKRCTLDLTGNIYSTAFSRIGPLNLTFDSCAMLLVNNAAYGIVDGLLSTDTLSINNSVIQGSSTYELINNFNGGGTTRSIASGVNSGWITNTTLTSNAQLDNTKSYAVASGTSPVIGVGTSTSAAPDYTGAIFRTRNDAGAREYAAAALAGVYADLKVPTGRLVIAGANLVGGGDLTGDVTLGLNSSISIAKLHVQPATSGDVGLIVQGQVSQSGNLTQWQNASGTSLRGIDKSGNDLISTHIGAATSGSISDCFPIFNISGTLLGYVPLYPSHT